MSRIFGHDKHRLSLQSAAEAGKLHHGWIFAGAKGVGKASFAIEIAKWLLGNTMQTESLIAAGTHPDFKVLRKLQKEDAVEGKAVDENDLKKNIAIDQIRALQRQMATKPSMGERRIVLIDAIDDLDAPGANALLKSLEEPPVGTIFLCVSHAPDRLLPTLRSRCQILRFEPLPRDAMASALRQALKSDDDDDIEALIDAGGGVPGRALSLAGLQMAQLDEALRRLASTGDADLSVRTALAASLSLKAAHSRYAAFLSRVPAFLSEEAARTAPANLAPILAAWEAADALQAKALPLNIDKSSVVLELANLVAGIAQSPVKA
jgi:DNA polymerase III subunit delta'